MLKRILSIAFLNFKEAAREKLFVGVVFFIIAYFAFCVLLGKLSVGHSAKVIRDIGLLGIEFSTILLMIFSLVSSFYREKNTRILDVYLVNFERSSYILGKALGYFLLLAFYLLFSALGFLLILFLFDAFHPSAAIAFYPLFLKGSIIICFAAIFSIFFSSPTLSIVCSFFIYLSSELAPSVVKILGHAGAAWQKSLMHGLYAILPNMDKLDMKRAVSMGIIPEINYFLSITLYTVIYVGVLLVVNIMIINSREY